MVSRLLHVFVLLTVGPLGAETIRVTVGDTGCVGRQQAVKAQWEKIPGVTSVVVAPREQKGSAAQRTFVITSSGPPPTPGVLRAALGRREMRYPVLDYRSSAVTGKP